jgi:hypothetical protein
MKQFILSIESFRGTEEMTSNTGSIYSIECHILVDGKEIDNINYRSPIVTDKGIFEVFGCSHNSYFEMLNDFIRFYNKHKLYKGEVKFELDNFIDNVYVKQLWFDAYHLGIFKGDKFNRVNYYFGVGIPERFNNNPADWIKWIHTVKNKEITGNRLEYLTDCLNGKVYIPKQIC